MIKIKNINNSRYSIITIYRHSIHRHHSGFNVQFSNIIRNIKFQQSSIPDFLNSFGDHSREPESYLQNHIDAESFIIYLITQKSSVTYFIRHLSRTTPKSCDFITQLKPVKLLVKIQFWKRRFRAIFTRIVFRKLQFAESSFKRKRMEESLTKLVKITDSKWCIMISSASLYVEARTVDVYSNSILKE